MGIVERKEREKKEMRQLILDAATRLFRKEGFEHTSIRKIAKEIEYSPGSIYLHFKNKDEIFYAVHAEFFNLLHDLLFQVMQIEDPLERLRAMGREYITFGIENPEVYNLMFVESAPMETIEDQDNWHSSMKTFELLVSAVQACIDAGYFPNKNLMQLVMIVFSNVHGIVTLKNHRDLKMFAEQDHEKMIFDSMNYMLELLQKA